MASKPGNDGQAWESWQGQELTQITQEFKDLRGRAFRTASFSPRGTKAWVPGGGSYRGLKAAAAPHRERPLPVASAASGGLDSRVRADQRQAKVDRQGEEFSTQADGVTQRSVPTQALWPSLWGLPAPLPKGQEPGEAPAWSSPSRKFPGKCPPGGSQEGGTGRE